MIAQGHGGKIIGAASIAGKRPFPFASAYVSSKFAVRGLTEVAGETDDCPSRELEQKSHIVIYQALELGKYGITVNAYAPGFTNSQMRTPVDLVDREMGTAFNMTPGQFKEESVGKLPLSRVGQPDDIANVVSFLASERASYITGQMISCDGGWL
ncbi:hypothetical protein EW146_g5625 [Bondarzewia mesenterica]|uniref:Uncharacterized protein n=1 Tax=Bondarzewia mesenterica TaxID=1095465 RepID=A0A4S4LWM1_9AGAM|nr:hypothetical protein EW146_g5625 [Bondarzewia mesenterica]